MVDTDNLDGGKTKQYLMRNHEQFARNPRCPIAAIQSTILWIAKSPFRLNHKRITFEKGRY